MYYTFKSTLFIASKDEWNTKKDTGKSMKMHCMYCQAEVTLNSEKIEYVRLAIVELC